ncbi:hypothetical protein FE257_010570 [Aspergillus nanangensis]|uniref:Flavoprotein oxygenase n=1 Tax=Aspergillus nanangensis TaxID=2582783 RepID=A0AAD4CIB1_ASPNN|nr:hypothetical protein FE257_010570 [Aspergillus nanangensis]
MEDPLHESQALALRPYSPSHDEPVPYSTLAITENPHELLHDEEFTELHDDAQLLVQDTGYNSSASSTQRSSSDGFGGGLEEERLNGTHSRTSSHSSVSSIPATVLTHTVDGSKSVLMRGLDDHMPLPSWDDRDIKPYSRMLHIVRQREAAFRKPSSVRAMQMHTEDEGDDEFLTPPKRKGGHRISDISMRSSGSSPLKRSPYYSPSGSLGRPKPKKEYPLVLLHCNLLPPSLPIPGMVGYPDQKMLKEVLPLEYWKRWKLLEEKVGSGVLRDRGVLISHPEDMYDVLEERLLESLELQRPRLDHGHFIGHDADSEKEVHLAREDGATDDEEGEECPDCGGRVITQSDEGRKWELKVFAANGLMRAGAWAAAWKEMEKVDVEVGLWLPSEIRRELEKRLFDNEMARKDDFTKIPRLQAPQTDISWTQSPTSLRDAHTIPLAHDINRPLSPAPEKNVSQEPPKPAHHYMTSSEDIDLQTLLVNYIRILATDRRNITIAILSILVVFFAIGSNPRATMSDVMPFPQDTLPLSRISIMSLAQHSGTATVDSTGSMSSHLAHSEPTPNASSVPESHDLTESAISSMTSAVSGTDSETLPSPPVVVIESVTSTAQNYLPTEVQGAHVAVQESVDFDLSSGDTEPAMRKKIGGSIDPRTDSLATVDHVGLSELVDTVVDHEQDRAEEGIPAVN